MIHLRSGYTRHVILTRRYAIKIGRIGFTSLLSSTWRVLARNRALSEKIAHYAEGGSFWNAVRNYLIQIPLHGARANLHESDAFSRYTDAPIAPVLGVYCFGLILVMPRGDPATPEESLELRMRYQAHDLRDRPDHVCWIGGELCFIDYGSPDEVSEF